MELDSTVQPSTPAAAPSSTPLRLTAAAVAQVKQIIQSQNFEGYTLAVRVVPAGCSGLGYDLNLVKDIKAGDVVWEQDGVKLATDALSLQYLNGTEMDYLSGLHESGFKFQNPNAKSSCGCGTSFST